MSCEAHVIFFFFNDTATTEIYTLSLHDALPILHAGDVRRQVLAMFDKPLHAPAETGKPVHHIRLQCLYREQRNQSHHRRSEEHTSELQSPCNLVCRLLLEKKKKQNNDTEFTTYG